MASVFSSCYEKSTPKPKAFARIDRVDSGISNYIGERFSFNYSKDAVLELIPSENKSEIWFNIKYPNYNTTIHCSYVPISKTVTLESLLEDSYHLAFSHSSKANSIDQKWIKNSDSNTNGVIYNINGNVATPIQFYMTDSISNFLRGSLYYERIVNPDSVASITSFMREDIQSLIESIKWNN